ncbi:MAG: tRNA (N6-isopentenyl adenosine(37)-C2)-methylthiotransferase MiaB [Dethiobacteria bacterium]|jgi:tRNA-2-methylthio-N6-dimethylallyladenosine synthase
MAKKDAQKRYFIITFGCQMNEHDSEAIAGILESEGYIRAEDKEDADLLIVNTCAVRRKAELKVLALIGRLRPLKEKKPEMLIAVCGCMAQQKEVAEYLEKRFQHLVDLIFGTFAIPRLPELLQEARDKKGTVIDIVEVDEGREGILVKREDDLKAWVTITYGCNNFCSYCIVPYVRGREKSRNPKDILREVKQLGKEGFKEVTLLGQNVNSYGKDLEMEITFAALLRELNKVEGIKRIRYMTSHPRDFTDELIEVIRDGEKICEHFHLPLQAGSNRILEKMNRGYSRERYLELVSKIREQIPDSAITTDLIVGFPGETEEDFADTIDMVERIRFDSAFTFVYSKRSGTPAAEMEDQVPEEEKKRRIAVLIDLQNRITRELNENLVGSVQEVLVEGVKGEDPDTYTGRTRTNKIVNFKADDSFALAKGELCLVKIEAEQTWNLNGKYLKTI